MYIDVIFVLKKLKMFAFECQYPLKFLNHVIIVR